jgi:hypothetical protein
MIWVEMKGNYQAAQMDYGNQFTDRVKTQKQVINIESMTLRTWIVEVETVAFDKDTARSILGMRGLQDEASALHAHLTNFGQRQSMVVAPTSEVDLQRASSLGVMNQQGSKLPAAAQELPSAVAQAIQSATACPSCQSASAAKSKFCPDCGTRLATS